MNKTIELELTQIVPDPKNPRQEFAPSEMKKLEDSIKTQGILTPLMVEETKNGKYLIVDGERRYRVAKRLNLKTVPATISAPLSDFQRLAKRFHLQEQHQSWSIFEKANAIMTFQEETKLSRSEIADTLGMAQWTIDNYLMVKVLSKRTATLLLERKLPFEWIVELSKMIKSIEDTEMRKPVEEAMLKKIDNRVIMSGKEMRRYTIAIKKGGIKIIERIIDKPKYSPNDALKDAGAELLQQFNSIYGSASFIVSHTSTVLSVAKTKEIEMPRRVVEMLSKCQDSISELLKLA
jgi:ParB/RepB/Spo0J family partition protein